MTDNQCQSILVFFRLSLMSPQLVQEAATEAYQNIEKLTRQMTTETFESIFVRSTSEIYHRVLATRGKAALNDHPVEISGLDLSPWRDFTRHAPKEEILSLIWVQILNLPIKSVAHGLSVTEGTIRHRVSRAIGKLANKVDPVETEDLRARRSWK